MERPEDRDLIEQTLAGNQRAFAVLVERYGREVYARIGRWVRYPEDVEDLAQEVFIRAYSRLGQLREVRRFPAWLRAIADNTARGWHRRRIVQLQLGEALEAEWAAETGNSGDEAEARRIRAMIRDALRSLSEAHRQVIVHHYFKGYTYVETADLLGLKVDTVRSRLQKARRRLREEMIAMRNADTPMQAFELTRKDLSALRWGIAFVSQDENRPILQGVCLDTGGRVVATDGARLLIRTAEGLKKIAAPVILGPWGEVEIPDAERATLSIGEESAVLQVQGEPDRPVSVIEGSYVKYESVIPTDAPVCSVTVQTGALLEAVELIGEHLAPRHPVDQEETWRYSPAMEIRLSVPDQTLSMITARNMGYRCKMPDGEWRPYDPHKDAGEGPPADSPDWTFTTTVQARVAMNGPEEIFRIGVNHAYWRSGICALEAGREEPMDFRFVGVHKAILCSLPDREDRKTLVMPLRLKRDEAGSEDSG